MQTCPDVSVLINAVNPASPQHQAARDYLQTAGSAGLLVLPDVAASFCRIVTNARVFSTPSTTAAARSVIEALLDRRGVSLSTPSSRRLAVMWRLCHDNGISGDEVADAFLLAGAVDLGATLVTFDRRLARLDGGIVRVL
jgi:toxin-antitoxin system PIN domain toxin